MSQGHSVLVVPVPELDEYIRDRTAHYDASFLSSDPAFVHAHITVLGPWLPEPSHADLDTVGSIMASSNPFDTTLATVDTFPDGLIHLRADPDGPLRALTAALVEAFPQCPPYEGRFPDPVPHLTLDRCTDGITRESVEADLRHRLPVHLHVDRVDLQWWANHDCHVRGSWHLGSPESEPGAPGPAVTPRSPVP